MAMSRLAFWSRKKVFITGHTGFKGSWLCKILERAGADITGYALEPSEEAKLFDICAPEMHSIIGDIRDFDSLLTAYKKASPEFVIHMAAQPLVLDSYQKPQYTYDVNAMGTVNILECARQHGGVKSFLNVTTDKVYQECSRHVSFKEDDALNGYDPYSNSKSCSELITSSYDKSFLRDAGISVSTVRSGNVIGGGDFSSNRLIPDCARALSQGEVIKVRNPDSVRPYQHVLDTLFAYLEIAEKQYHTPSLAGAYNIGPDDSASSKELADYFCMAWGGKASWEHLVIDNPHESAALALDCSKVKQKIGWSPRWDIRRSVEETALWYQAYYKDDDFNAVMSRQIKEFAEEPL